MAFILGGRELEERETMVLLAFPHPHARLTVNQLGRLTALSGPELRGALDTLIDKRVVARLNTVIESYAQRRESAPSKVAV